MNQLNKSKFKRQGNVYLIYDYDPIFDSHPVSSAKVIAIRESENHPGNFEYQISLENQTEAFQYWVNEKRICDGGCEIGSDDYILKTKSRKELVKSNMSEVV